MTTVGTGLDDSLALFPARDAPVSLSGSSPSIWKESTGSLFNDQRASRPGDILTVNISINDKAQLGNSSDRMNESQIKGSIDYGTQLFGLNALGAASADLGSRSASKGEGAINRSERIQLSIAAIVTRVLPNGALYVRGSQEIRVNFELRVLTIAGIVRKSDIARDNTVSYDKIAEARVSYGGRGRIMEVQQPAVGQQIIDMLKPF
jgi:flagellar L-ring protein precursor FlgH